eukprot:scaffold227149_cov37-Prasinocladus_malaysianus.AAC.1
MINFKGYYPMTNHNADVAHSMRKTLRYFHALSCKTRRGASLPAVLFIAPDHADHVDSLVGSPGHCDKIMTRAGSHSCIQTHKDDGTDEKMASKYFKLAASPTRWDC